MAFEGEQIKDELSRIVRFRMLLEYARSESLKKATHEIRHGSDLTRAVKPWPRMQAQWNLGGDQLDDTMVEGQKKVSSFPGFVRETFSRLYTGDNLSKLTPRSEARWAERMHGMLDDLPEWQRLMSRCRGDAYSTTLATTGLAGNLVGQIPQHKQDAQDARRKLDLAQEDFEDEKESTGDESLPAPPEIAKLESEFESAEKEAEALANSMSQSAARQAMRAAIEKANGELDEVDRAMQSMGWSHEDSCGSQDVAAKTKAAVAQRLRDSTKLSEIMRLAGRMKNIMREAQATKVRHGVSEITDIECGADIARLLPSELMLLRHPQMKLLLARKLYEYSALQYHLEAKEKVGRGPVVVCIDDSGSMRGEREIWSKAIALALLELARKQGRAFAYCTFSNALSTTFVEHTGKKSSPQDILDRLSEFCGGGTNFDPPLAWGLDRIEDDSKLEDADIVFISDGECAASNAVSHKARLKVAGARCWGIALGGSAMNATGHGSMQDFCERVWPVSDLQEGEKNEEEIAATRGVLGI